LRQPQANVHAQRTQQANAFAAATSLQEGALKMREWKMQELKIQELKHMESRPYRNKCKKLQFIHTVNGDGSKTAKIIKRQC